MGVLREPAFGVRDADQREQFDGTFVGLFFGHAHVNEQRLLDLQPDGQHRVQGGHRLLEDHGDVTAANLAHLLVVEFEQGATVEFHRAVQNPRRVGRQQAHDGQRRDRLARPRLAHDGDHLTGAHGIAQAFDRAHATVRGHEVNV